VLPVSSPDEGVVERVVDDAERHIAVLEPPAPLLLALAAEALDASSMTATKGRRFSQLDRPQAVGHVERLELRRSALWRVARLLRDLMVVAYYEQDDVREAVGYQPDPWIAERTATRAHRWADDIEHHRQLLLAPAPLRGDRRATPARAAGTVHRGDDMPQTGLECDVVVVGSGAGGAVVAAELAEAGLDVIVVEEGDHHPTETFTTATADALRTLYRSGGASAILGRAPIGYSEGRCVGGSTVVNGGMAFRAPERVLQAWADASELPGLARGELDGEYARVERFLSVTTQDADSVGRDQRLLVEGAERLGWRVVECQRAQVHCAGCNVCTWGCPTGAKQSTLVSYLPRALSFGAHVWANCRVERVDMSGKRAVGVSGVVSGPSTGSRPFRIRARRVVVSCGAVQTPALLLRSGIRSPSGQVGHNLFVHPGSQVAAVYDDEVDGWKGAHESHQIREFEAEGIILAAVNLPPSLVARSLPMNGERLAGVMRDYNRIVTAGVLVEDTAPGRVRAMGRGGRPLATYAVSDRDSRRVVRALGLLSEALLASGAHTVYPAIEGIDPLRSPDDAKRLGSMAITPERVALSTVHLMGTAGIGSDPHRSVCGPDGSVHDTADLFVADASLFPGPVGVNPMLTIMALATRVASGILESWPRRGAPS
jgi:choline dehydrogenase-like flavoprotein